MRSVTNEVSLPRIVPVVTRDDFILVTVKREE